MSAVKYLFIFVVVFIATVIGRLPAIKYISLKEMGKDLTEIPEIQEQDNLEVISMNVAYNRIVELTNDSLSLKSYRYLCQIELSNNRINRIEVNAFKGLNKLEKIDLSNNNLVTLHMNLFITNEHLEKLDLANNQLSFDYHKPFLVSDSLHLLILSNNQIDQLSDESFSKLPKLNKLFLDGNSFSYLSAHCFTSMRHLHFINLANTGIYHLTKSMFTTFPKLIDLTGTILAKKFDPPLKIVANEQLIDLINVDADSSEDGYFKN